MRNGIHFMNHDVCAYLVAVETYILVFELKLVSPSPTTFLFDILV